MPTQARKTPTQEARPVLYLWGSLSAHSEPASVLKLDSRSSLYYQGVCLQQLDQLGPWLPTPEIDSADASRRRGMLEGAERLEKQAQTSAGTQGHSGLIGAPLLPLPALTTKSEPCISQALATGPHLKCQMSGARERVSLATLATSKFL